MRRAVVVVTIGLEVKLRIKQRFVRIACQWTEERKLNAPGGPTQLYLNLLLVAATMIEIWNSSGT